MVFFSLISGSTEMAAYFARENKNRSSYVYPPIWKHGLFLVITVDDF